MSLARSSGDCRQFVLQPIRPTANADEVKECYGCDKRYGTYPDLEWKPHEAQVEHERNAVTKKGCEDYEFPVSVSHAKANDRKIDL